MSNEESIHVTKQHSLLEIHAISEMVSHSSKPSVPSVALQALAALHGRDDFDLKFPDGLWRALHSHFEDCFQQDAVIGNTTLLESADCERFARALLLRWFYYPSTGMLHVEKSKSRSKRRSLRFESNNDALQIKHHTVDRIKKLFSLEPGNLHFSAFKMFLISLGHCGFAKKALCLLLDHLTAPPIKISNLHGCICSQFEDAVSTESSYNWTIFESTADLPLNLLWDLSPDKLPSFQEAMILRLLNAELNYHSQENCPVVSPFDIYRLPQISNLDL